MSDTQKTDKDTTGSIEVVALTDLLDPSLVEHVARAICKAGTGDACRNAARAALAAFIDWQKT